MNPLSFQYLHEFLPWDITDQVRANAALGGIPAYLHKFNRRLNFWKNISENILEKGTYVYSEAEILLNYEFREPANYMVLPGPMHQGKEA
ncbi:hypothetical protein [Methanospirillum purgamenti]|nr:hypothetical protein [Methanospirillum hungatei]MDX8550445.1 hypothetical protein [Methanospirillum hungatei]